MTRWKKDITSHCNDIYQYSNTEEIAESTLDSILGGKEEEISEILEEAKASGNNKLYLAVDGLNKMRNYTRDCLQEKDQVNVDNHVHTLKVTVLQIRHDRGENFNIDDELEDNLEVESSSSKMGDSPLRDQEQVKEFFISNLLQTYPKLSNDDATRMFNNSDDVIKRKISESITQQLQEKKKARGESKDVPDASISQPFLPSTANNTASRQNGIN